MKASTLHIAIGLLLAAAFACTKQSLQATYDKQETTIDAFVAARTKADPDATVTRNGGSVRVVMHDTLSVEGDDSLHVGGTVSFYYAGYLLTSANIVSTNLVATNRKQTATEAGWNLSDTTQFHIETITLDDSLLPGLYDGLQGVQDQDECYILFSGKYGYGKSKQGTIPAKSALVYHIWVESIDNE